MTKTLGLVNASFVPHTRILTLGALTAYRTIVVGVNTHLLMDHVHGIAKMTRSRTLIQNYVNATLCNLMAQIISAMCVAHILILMTIKLNA